MIVTGTGFNDIKELQTDDFRKLMKQEDADYDHIWELYIAVKIAIKLGQEGYYSGENLVEFYRQIGLIEDFRILSLLKQLWGVVIGTIEHYMRPECWKRNMEKVQLIVLLKFLSYFEWGWVWS